MFLFQHLFERYGGIEQLQCQINPSLFSFFPENHETWCVMRLTVGDTQRQRLLALGTNSAVVSFSPPGLVQ